MILINKTVINNKMTNHRDIGTPMNQCTVASAKKKFSQNARFIYLVSVKTSR